MSAMERLKAKLDAICAANPTAPLARLRAATLAARGRTGNVAIGTSVQQGLYTVCLVTYQGRRTDVQPLASGLSVEGAIAYLDAMQA